VEIQPDVEKWRDALPPAELNSRLQVVRGVLV
jgi:hypothetical protein